MNNKRLILWLLVCSLVLNVALGFVIFFNQQNSSNSATQADVSDAAIKKMFDCDRVTADYRETDIFCTKPELYRQALR